MHLQKKCSQLESDARLVESRFQQAASNLQAQASEHESIVSSLKEDLQNAQDLSQTLQKVRTHLQFCKIRNISSAKLKVLSQCGIDKTKLSH